MIKTLMFLALQTRWAYGHVTLIYNLQTPDQFQYLIAKQSMILYTFEQKVMI